MYNEHNYLKDSTLYNKEHNIEFWNIPKNAMTSIISDLGFVWTSSSQLPKDRKIFCVIRNPLDRFLSSYMMCRNQLYGPSLSVYNCRYIDPRSSMFNIEDDINQGYSDYINEILTNGPFDAHNMSQTWYINDHLAVDAEGMYWGGVVHTYPNYLRVFSNITDFISMDNLNEGLSKLFNKEIILDKLNTTSILPSIKKSLDEITKKNKTKILAYYKEDQLLYDKVNKIK